MSNYSLRQLAFAGTPAAMTTDPRKRPRQPRSRDTVAVIVEAAARIIESDGLAGYNTNAIARRAGVSIGSLYQYFAGKDAVTAELIRRETAAMIADGRAALAMDDPVAALRHVLGAGVRHQLSRPVLARVLDAEEARLPMAADTMSVGEALAGLIATLLRRPGAPVVPAPDEAAFDVLAILRGIADVAGMRGETDPVALAARVEAAVFGYLDRRGLTN